MVKVNVRLINNSWATVLIINLGYSVYSRLRLGQLQPLVDVHIQLSFSSLQDFGILSLEYLTGSLLVTTTHSR